MLDAISDFWKPSRKEGQVSQVDSASIEPGSTIGFGFIPQSELSGKRITVKGINTYLFESDRMTSFVLDAGEDVSISLIIADSDQEKYIAISRKIPFADRPALFDNNALLACMDGDEKKRLTVKSSASWAAWMTDEYKKAMGGLKGKVTAGDYRNMATLPTHLDAKEFTYTLLVSNNHEYALEIEQYSDNKMEVYATVYRRLTDIGEVTPPRDPAQMQLPPKPVKTTSTKVAKTASELAALKPANDTESKTKEAKTEKAPVLEKEFKREPVTLDSAAKPVQSVVAAAPSSQTVSEVKPLLDKFDASLPEAKDTDVIAGPLLSSETTEEKVLAHLPEEIEPVKETVPSLKQAEVDKVELPNEEQSVDNDVTVTEVKHPHIEELQAIEIETEVEEEVTSQSETKPSEEKEHTMATFNANLNGSTEQKAEAFQARAIQPQTVEVENDSVECELPAASRVIEEAIRNEMSMSDVIRRVVALPVARQESVSIPVMLTDADYSLLAVRYGIPAADRAAIKAKIIEEIGEFSGSSRQ